MYRVLLLSSQLSLDASSRGRTFSITEIVPARERPPVDNACTSQTATIATQRALLFVAAKLDNTAVPFKADSFVLSFLPVF